MIEIFMSWLSFIIESLPFGSNSFNNIMQGLSLIVQICLVLYLVYATFASIFATAAFGDHEHYPFRIFKDSDGEMNIALAFIYMIAHIIAVMLAPIIYPIIFIVCIVILSGQAFKLLNKDKTLKINKDEQSIQIYEVDDYFNNLIK